MSVIDSRWGAPSRLFDSLQVNRSQASKVVAIASAVVLLGGGTLLGAAIPNHGHYVLLLVGAVIVAVVGLRTTEFLWAVLFVVGLLGFVRLGTDWTYAEAFLVAVVFIRDVARQRRPKIPAILALYLGWFVVMLAHGSFHSTQRHALINFVLPPLVAVATATVCRDRSVRRRITLLLLASALIEMLVIWGESGLWFGFHISNTNADALTGTTGPYTANLIGYVMVLPGTIFLALAVERVWRPKLMLLVAVGMALCGILTQSRAVFAGVPAAYGAVLLTYGFSWHRSRGARRALALLIPAAILVPAMVVAYEFVNPQGLSGSDLTTVAGIKQYLNAQHPGGALPGYAVQLRTALRRSVAGGPITFATGRGLGAANDSMSQLPPVNLGGGTNVSSAITSTNTSDLYPFLDADQRTGGIWFGIVLTETGWIGILLFLSVLAYMTLLGRRTRTSVASGSLDRAVLVALPGVALLTLLGSVYIQLFFQPPYTVFFWPLLGIAIAIGSEARSKRRAHHSATPSGITSSVLA